LHAQNQRQEKARPRRKYVQRASEAGLTLPLPRAEV
jgi:hypothetical protein